MPLLLYLSVSKWCFNILLIMFCVQKATLSCMFLKSLVICLTSFLQYVKVILWWLGSFCMFSFVVMIVVSQVDLCYIHFSLVFFYGVFFLVLIFLLLDTCVTDLVGI
jgi:hypothetical protein